MMVTGTISRSSVSKNSSKISNVDFQENQVFFIWKTELHNLLFTPIQILSKYR